MEKPSITLRELADRINKLDEIPEIREACKNLYIWREFAWLAVESDLLALEAGQ